MKIWNSNLRFNIDKPLYREAYDNLHEMDRKKYKSCNHVIAVAVNEYFKCQRQSERDPYFETREREQQFINEIDAFEYKVSSFFNLWAALCYGVSRHATFALCIERDCENCQGRD